MPRSVGVILRAAVFLGQRGLSGLAQHGTYDLAVVGGGINGVGIARDAAGRGLSVFLCDQGDLGGATSSASTKLIHGGLRYLEYYEFRLVREALAEREVLLRAAPHIIQPMRFILPHVETQRPAWMIRLGLFLYDHLGGRRILAGSRGVDLRRDPVGAPLTGGLRRGFEYADCAVDDARLVVLNAVDAAERGAEIRPRTCFESARRADRLWRVAVLDLATGRRSEIVARALVNAAGPWVSSLLERIAGQDTSRPLRLVKGSHIVVDRLYEGDQAYILQDTGNRVIFAIPYERDFTLIGTTEVDYRGDPGQVAADDDEIAYLCAQIDRYFSCRITPEDVVWSYSGVRPLYEEAAAGKSASAVTRDYVLELDGRDGAPLLSVLGGKITTYRRLAEHALERLQPLLDFDGTPWTADAALPGGDIAEADFAAFLAGVRPRWPWLPAGLAERLAHAYGTRIAEVLGEAGSLADLGADLGGGLHEAELEYLAAREWARTAEDVLWRRSKLGLRAPEGTAERIASWLERRNSTRGARVAC